MEFIVVCNQSVLPVAAGMILLLTVVGYFLLPLQKTDPRNKKTSFVSLEIHVVPESESSEDPQAPRYRVFSHTGTLEDRDKQARK